MQGTFSVEAGNIHAVGSDAVVAIEAEERVKRLQIPAAHLHGVAGVEAAARGQEDELRGPTEALQARLRGTEGDAVDRDLLDVDLQQGREGKIPERSGDDDAVRLRELVRVAEARMVPLPSRWVK